MMWTQQNLSQQMGLFKHYRTLPIWPLVVKPPEPAAQDMAFQADLMEAKSMRRDATPLSSRLYHSHGSVPRRLLKLMRAAALSESGYSPAPLDPSTPSAKTGSMAI